MNEWISLQEKRPPEDGNWFVICTNGIVTIAPYLNGGFCGIDDIVTHWMPLPSPPGDSEKQVRTFTVTDNKTGEYPDCEKIALEEDWAKHLIYCDIDGFYIGEDGTLILMDDCGNCAFTPAGRFTVVWGDNE